MIQRELETEIMESQAEAIAYDDMDHRRVNEQFVADLLATGKVRGEALDVGTGTARIPLLLCERHEDVRVIGTDLSTNMLEIAWLHIHTSSMLDRVMLDRVDAKQLPFDSNRFNVVMSNSIIHHIPDPKLVFAESIRVCKPSGLLFFRDLFRPESEAELRQLCETYVSQEAEHGQRMFEDSLRAALTVEEVRSMVGELGLSPGDVVATSDRHWTWVATKPG